MLCLHTLSLSLSLSHSLMLVVYLCTCACVDDVLCVHFDLMVSATDCEIVVLCDCEILRFDVGTVFSRPLHC